MTGGTGDGYSEEYFSFLKEGRGMWLIW
jgi:hypothetical protein